MSSFVRFGGQGVSRPFVKTPMVDGTGSTSASSSTIVSVEYPASASTASSRRAAVQDYRLSDTSSDTESETISYGDITDVYAFDERRLTEAKVESMKDKMGVENAALFDALAIHMEAKMNAKFSDLQQAAKTQTEEDARLEAANELRLKAKEEARLKAEEDARLDAAKELRLKAKEEARLKAEEDARLKAAREARLKPPEEARSKADEDAKKTKKAEECALSNLKQFDRDLAVAREVDKESRCRRKDQRSFRDVPKEATVSEFLHQKSSKQQPFLFSHREAQRPEKNRSGTPVLTGQRASVRDVQPLENKRLSGYTKTLTEAVGSQSTGRGQLATVPGGWDMGALRSKKRGVRS